MGRTMSLSSQTHRDSSGMTSGCLELARPFTIVLQPWMGFSVYCDKSLEILDLSKPFCRFIVNHTSCENVHLFKKSVLSLIRGLKGRSIKTD